jgi:hypothetical protein
LSIPATTFETADVEPNENSKPRNTPTPLKAGDSSPGRYGTFITATNARIRKRTILEVGSTYSG